MDPWDLTGLHGITEWRPCCACAAAAVGVMGTASAVLTLWMMEQAARKPSTVRRASTVLPLSAVQEITFQSSTFSRALQGDTSG